VDPYTYWAHYRMARLFEDRKQTEDAIRQYEFILKYAFDRDADVYLKLAKIYQSEGRIKEARRVLAKGKRLFPTNADIFRLYQDVAE
jgi:tetratricopeptide (TPR) repeat protein